MQWEPLDDPYRITKIASQLQDGEVILTWHWPKDIDYVYVYSFAEGEELLPEQLTVKQLKLFTREEYKIKSGYREKVDYIGVQGYRIFPCLRQGGLMPLMQTDDHNVIRVNGGRAKIRWSVKYGGKLFSRYRSARIQLFCEIPVPQDTLCYVIKEGGSPASKEDGIAYPFMSDFPVGRTVLPEIEIAKNDAIRVFLAHSERDRGLFELIYEA